MLSKFQNIWMCSCSETPLTQVYHWMMTVFLAKSMKQPFLNEISCVQNLSNPLKNVGGFEEIIIGWCTISQWMTMQQQYRFYKIYLLFAFALKEWEDDEMRIEMVSKLFRGAGNSIATQGNYRETMIHTTYKK